MYFSTVLRNGSGPSSGEVVRIKLASPWDDIVEYTCSTSTCIFDNIDPGATEANSK